MGGALGGFAQEGANQWRRCVPVSKAEKLDILSTPASRVPGIEKKKGEKRRKDLPSRVISEKNARSGGNDPLLQGYRGGFSRGGGDKKPSEHFPTRKN